ncbi:MAG TPA: twin-arginine translocase TatA/TatE family subunit [Polyangia bacterium]|nr:twin-arginine translocase TatA/TatE family subunit [Polyangia bacterium]
MFGLGMGELIVILAIALIFLGPKRLPDVATSLGKAIRSFRKATSDLTAQLEIDDAVKKPLRELQSALRDEPPPPQPLATMQLPPQPKNEGIAPVPVAKTETPAAPSGTAAPPLPSSAVPSPPPLPLDKKA